MWHASVYEMTKIAFVRMCFLHMISSSLVLIWMDFALVACSVHNERVFVEVDRSQDTTTYRECAAERWVAILDSSPLTMHHVTIRKMKKNTIFKQKNINQNIYSHSLQIVKLNQNNRLSPNTKLYLSSSTLIVWGWESEKSSFALSLLLTAFCRSD